MSSNYPMMSQSEESNAPWNEKRNEELAFDVDVTFTMSKRVTVKTDDYEQKDDYTDTSLTDFEMAYDANGHYTIAELLNELKTYIMADMKTCGDGTGKGVHLRHLLEECDGWSIVAEYEER